ncbi:MAG TPA: CBS domain-containing protein [Euzebyales bacterium]|nr:CBS domain-containing protein [Euzebyales bacterium]
MQPIMYATRVARLPVLAPDGGDVGVVSDLVIGPAHADHGPFVYGFVVTVPGRSIFLGSGRVARIDSEGVHLSSGALNLRRFTPRPTETLVLTDLMDRQLPDAAGERVNDVGIAASPRRARSWEVVTVDVAGPRAGRLRPARGRRSAGWEVLRPLLAQHDDYEHLRDLHPTDAATRIAALPASQRAAAAGTLDDEHLADVLEELPADVQATLLSQLDVERAADVLEAMEPDDAADVLGDLPPGGQTQLLAAMESEDAAVMRRLLAYGDDTAGGLMNPEPIVLTGGAAVAEALARLQEPDLPPAMASQVFVVRPPAQTPTGAFEGQVGVQRLLREPPSRPLRECLDLVPDPLPPDASGADVAQHMAAYNLLAVPICDPGGRLLGVVTVDDMLDHLLPEGWRRR